MKILIFSDNYPSDKRPQSGTFVYKFVQSIVKHGCIATVLAPGKLYNSFGRNKSTNKEYGMERAIVHRPFVLSVSNRWIFNWNTFQVYKNGKIRVLKKYLRKTQVPNDIIYCHFLSNALIAAEVCMNSNIPIVAAVGEFKNIDVVKSYYKSTVYNKLIDRIDGFISVSLQVRDKLVQLGVNKEKIVVLPNATDRMVFKPQNKVESRNKFGLPQDKLLVLFVGRFVENKGPLRLLEAVNSIEGNILSVFVGDGIQDDEISGDKVVMKGPLSYEKIPMIMSACDLFVLPTLHEGSSNVIVEAMACGLPIISSDIPEIREQCTPMFSLLLDPINISELKIGIEKMLSDPDGLAAMGQAALNYSEKFDLDNRTINIKHFCENIIAHKLI